jgi:hypothetical protein
MPNIQTFHPKGCFFRIGKIFLTTGKNIILEVKGCVID